MKNEQKIKRLPPDTAREIESTKLRSRDLESAVGAGGAATLEWIEDSIITKRSNVEFGKNEIGKETAKVKVVNPETNKEEVIYFTTEPDEIVKFKSISRGEVIINDFSSNKSEQKE